MTPDRILALKLVTDVGDINKKMGKVEGRFKSMAHSATQWGKAFTTGFVLEGIDAVGTAISDGIKGFRDGERVAAQLGVTWKNLGQNGKAFQRTLDKVTQSTLALGTSDDEAVKAFTNSLQRTHDYHESLKRLKIAQDLVANGSAPNLNAAFKLIDKAATGSKGVVDKFGLTSKTAAGRVKQLGDHVRGAAKKAAALNPLGVTMNLVSEAFESISGILVTGNIDKGLDDLRIIGDKLTTAWLPIVEFLNTKTGGGLGDTLTKVSELGRAISEKLNPAIAAMSGLWAVLQPILSSVLTAVQPVIDLFDNAIVGSLGYVIDQMTLSITILKDLLKGDFSQAWTDLKTNIEKIAGQISGIVGGMVSGIISAWNSLDLSIPAFSLHTDGFQLFEGTPFQVGVNAQDFQVWGGTGDLIPDIGGGGRGSPSNDVSGFGRHSKHMDGSHKSGLDRVPFDGYMAQLHRNEAVLPAAEASQWRGGGGHTIIINNYGGANASLGSTVVQAIQQYEKRSGNSWRRVTG